MLVQIGWPVAVTAIGDPRVEGFKWRFSQGALWKGNAVSLLDAWGSKKLGHAAAISRHSLTAIAPEALVGFASAHDANLDPSGTVNLFVARTNGYDAHANSFATHNAKDYLVAKYGLGIGRKIVNQTRLADPIKKALGMMGVSL